MGPKFGGFRVSGFRAPKTPVFEHRGVSEIGTQEDPQAIQGLYGNCRGPLQVCPKTVGQES